MPRDPTFRFPIRLLPLLLAAFLSRAPARAFEPEAPGQVPVYAIWEARFPVEALPDEARGRNPFDPGALALDAVLTDPAGDVRRVPLFLYQPYRRAWTPERTEHLVPVGDPIWMLRVAPLREGNHTVQVRVRIDGEDAGLLGETAFRATPPVSRGFLRTRAGPDPAFVFDDGTLLRALGHNVTWVLREQGTYGFDRYFGAMADAGATVTRVWLSSWGLSLDTKRPYEVDLADAWRLDHVLREAERQDLVLLLTLDNFHDLRNAFTESPFAEANGGPCRTRLAFFTSEAARGQYRARLRYIVARYGALRSLLAWELWNEMNYALTPAEKASAGPDPAAWRSVMIDWTIQAARDLHALDAHAHPVTTSLGNQVIWPELWALPEMDCVQVHGYIGRIGYLRSAHEEDAARFVLDLYDAAARFGKPALVSEFGYAGDGPVSPLNPRDPQGIAFHNAIWAGALGSGHAPLHWWWDNYLAPYGLTDQYAPLAELLRALPPDAAAIPMRTETEALRLLALHSDDAVVLWIQNRAHTWHRVLQETQPPAPREGVRLRFGGFRPGTWEVQWLDPWTGMILREESVRAREGTIRLTVPPFATDVACRLIRGH